MSITVIAFGSLTEILPSSTQWQADCDTDALLEHLYKQYPSLKGRKFAIAVQQKIIQQNTVLQEGDTIALMPAFSGG